MSQGARQRVQCSPRSQSDQAYKSDQRGLHLATLSIQRIYRQLPDARHPQRFCLHASTGQCQVWSMVGLPWIGIVLACPTDARSDWDVGNLRAWVDTLRSLSCSYHHSWEVFAMCWHPRWWGVLWCVSGWCLSSGIHMKARTSSFSAEHCIIRRWSIVFISPDKGFTIVADQCMDTVYQCLLYICVYRFCQALAGAQSLSPAHNVIRMYSVCPPQCLISWLEVRAIVWKKGSMSVSSHVQAVVACGQPSFMNANKKRRSKKLSKHYWHLTIACLREPFHFSARYIKN